MNSMLPIWLFIFWTIGAPLLWLLSDRLQTQKATRICSDSPMPLRAATPSPA
jgi:hypothetical protein